MAVLVEALEAELEDVPEDDAEDDALDEELPENVDVGVRVLLRVRVDAAVRVLDEDEVELRVDESMRVAVAASERAREGERDRVLAARVLLPQLSHSMRTST